jgi:hypothetical protein
VTLFLEVELFLVVIIGLEVTLLLPEVNPYNTPPMASIAAVAKNDHSIFHDDAFILILIYIKSKLLKNVFQDTRIGTKIKLIALA